jgi:hypothetical protein
MLHMQPMLVLMLLACVLSAAYVMRPEEEGTGNTYQAFSLLKRRDALQQQQKQHLVSGSTTFLHCLKHGNVLCKCCTARLTTALVPGQAHAS